MYTWRDLYRDVLKSSSWVSIRSSQRDMATLVIERHSRAHRGLFDSNWLNLELLLYLHRQARQSTIVNWFNVWKTHIWFFFFYNYFIFAGHESERINSSLAVLIITDNRTDMFNRVLSVCLNLTYVLDSKALSYIQDFFFSHLIFSFFLQECLTCFFFNFRISY